MKATLIAASIALASGLGLGAWLTAHAKAAQIQGYETRMAQLERDQERLRVAAALANAQALQANTDKANAAALLAAQEGEQINAQYRTVTTYIEKVVDRPVYRTVCLDADGVRQLNDFIRGAGD